MYESKNVVHGLALFGPKLIMKRFDQVERRNMSQHIPFPQVFVTFGNTRGICIAAALHVVDKPLIYRAAFIVDTNCDWHAVPEDLGCIVRVYNRGNPELPRK